MQNLEGNCWHSHFLRLHVFTFAGRSLQNCISILIVKKCKLVDCVRSFTLLVILNGFGKATSLRCTILTGLTFFILIFFQIVLRWSLYLYLFGFLAPGLKNSNHTILDRNAETR